MLRGQKQKSGNLMPSVLQPSTTVSGKFRRRLRRIAWLSVFGCTLFFILHAFRTPLLTALAETWVVNDPTAKADVIVVLGGKPDLRPFEAARLYHAGVAPRILYMDVKLNPAAELGLMPSEREITRRVLLSNNVPETAMMAVGNGVATTYDESCAIRAWLATNAAKSILISTDIFHTRRAQWIFARELNDTGVKVHTRAITPKEYDVSNWWQHEEGVTVFQNELLKLIYYRCKY
jgi:uncharacterized SAM-binding protein YcdF (DUF218 family)